MNPHGYEMSTQAAKAQHISLPWPPSVNHYWRARGVKRFISSEGQLYREAVTIGYIDAGSPEPLEGPISLTIRVMEPNKRRRDLDNLLKAPLDALAHAGWYRDDSQIHDLRIYRGGYEEGGALYVLICQLVDEQC